MRRARDALPHKSDKVTERQHTARLNLACILAAVAFGAGGGALIGEMTQGGGHDIEHDSISGAGLSVVLLAAGVALRDLATKD